jgi:magnesium transporter
VTPENREGLRTAVWIDLFCPDKEEETQIEELLGFDLPTPEEMREIEYSSRLYKEVYKDGTLLFMTAMMIAHSQTEKPSYDSVTFVLSDKQLVTLRYIDPQAFHVFQRRLKKLDVEQRHPLVVI